MESFMENTNCKLANRPFSLDPVRNPSFTLDSLTRITPTARRHSIRHSLSCSSIGYQGSRSDTPLLLDRLPTVDSVPAENHVFRTRHRPAYDVTAEENAEGGSFFHGEQVQCPPATCPRLLDRGATFHQSHGRLQVRRMNDTGTVRHLRWGDQFHNLVSMHTAKLICVCVAMVVSSWMTIALFIMYVSKDCGLEADTFLKSLYISIETIETIGYGIPDPMMKGCTKGVFVLGFASIWGSLLNALIIGLVFTRISRAQGRATSVCFTEKGIICRVDGKVYFMFQVFDFRKHQLCEAHVRLYCVQHTTTPEGVTYQTRAMRLQHPDDELGGMLLLALPQTIVHCIDPWSPLCPPNFRNIPGGTKAACMKSFPDVLQRASDSENGNRDIGKSYRPAVPSLQDVARHMAATQMEVLCLVEGVEPQTSGTLQARCSYTNDDIVYNASFQRCVQRGLDGSCEVNLDAFHELVPIPNDDILVQSMP